MANLSGMQIGTSLLAGCGIGILFFGGLWLTLFFLHQGKKMKHWLIFSFVIRLSLAAAGFYFLTDWGWQSLALALLAFFMIRKFLTDFVQKNSSPLIVSGKREI